MWYLQTIGVRMNASNGSEVAPKVPSRALLVLLVCSGLCNIILGVRLIAAKSSPSVPALVYVQAGARLPMVLGWGPDERPVSLSDSSLPTVLLVLRPGCHWCDANMPNWQRLIDGARQRYRFVAVSFSENGLAEYLQRYRLLLPAITSLPRGGVFDQIRAGGTPQTIVVGPDGTVRRAWLGACSSQTKLEVEHFFGISLPLIISRNRTAPRASGLSIRMQFRREA